MPILAKIKSTYSDEAHFEVGGYVNKQNCRIWGAENPHAYIEKLTHPKRASVWSGFWSRGIIKPFAFENEAEMRYFSSKISKERPLQSMAIVIGLLNEFLFTNIEEEDIGNISKWHNWAIFLR